MAPDTNPSKMPKGRYLAHLGSPALKADVVRYYSKLPDQIISN
jgi:hypothetical protein